MSATVEAETGRATEVFGLAVQMGWLIEFAVHIVAELFGEAVGRRRPWWVELVATLGCFVVLGLPILLLWIFLR